jgi:hypothetical protein
MKGGAVSRRQFNRNRGREARKGLIARRTMHRNGEHIAPPALTKRRFEMLLGGGQSSASRSFAPCDRKDPPLSADEKVILSDQFVEVGFVPARGPIVEQDAQRFPRPHRRQRKARGVKEAELPNGTLKIGNCCARFFLPASGHEL